MQTDRVRYHYRFYGSVQGVGFRYRAHYLASGLGITGFVCNCWDGSVEMEAQGTQAALDRMLTLLQQGTWIRVERMECQPIAVELHDSGFHVR